jgi:hypothetical protein
MLTSPNSAVIERAASKGFQSLSPHPKLIPDGHARLPSLPPRIFECAAFLVFHVLQRLESRDPDGAKSAARDA